MMDKKLILIVLILLSLQAVYAEEFYVTNAKAFVSPDSSYVTLKEFVDGAEKSLYISVYELDGSSVADLIISALDRGVDVEIILEESPVNGVSKIEKAIIKKLRENGARIHFEGDPDISFFHPKYSVADNNTLLINSENFGDTGFSSDNTYGNRGWGVVIEDSDLAMFFVNLFFDDLADSKRTGGRGSISDYPPTTGDYKPQFDSSSFSALFTVQTIVAPKNAVEEIINLLDSAEKSVYIEQFYIYTYWGKKSQDSVESAPNLFLEAAIDAARRGCDVKILLDSTWYNVERDDPTSNYNTMKYVNEIARKEGLNLEAKLINIDRAGLVKLHNKGVVVDDSKVLISSVNWNQHSPTLNREVGLIIEGDVANYYSEVFLYDWEGGQRGDSNNYFFVFITVSSILVVIVIYRRRKK